MKFSLRPDAGRLLDPPSACPIFPAARTTALPLLSPLVASCKISDISAIQRNKITIQTSIVPSIPRRRSGGGMFPRPREARKVILLAGAATEARPPGPGARSGKTEAWQRCYVALPGCEGAPRQPVSLASSAQQNGDRSKPAEVPNNESAPCGGQAPRSKKRSPVSPLGRVIVDVRTTIPGSVTHRNHIGGLKHRFANQDRTVTIDVSPEERLPIWGRIDVGRRAWPWIAAGARSHRIRAASVPQVPGFSGTRSGYRGRPQNKRGSQNRLDAFHESRSPDDE